MSKFNVMRFPKNLERQKAFEKMLETAPTIYQAVSAKMTWLQKQCEPALFIRAFVSDCIGWRARYGIEAGDQVRANNVIYAPKDTDLQLLVLDATSIILILAYKHEGAYQHMLTSPHQSVIHTASWWKDITPGWVIA